MARIAGDGADRVEIEGLAVKNVADQAFLQQVDQIFGRAAADKAGFHVGLAHHAGQVIHKRQRDAAGACLEGKAVAHDAAVAQEARYQFGNPQPVGTARDLRGAADDLRGIADGVHFDDIVHVVALNLPGHAGEGHKVVGDDDDAIGINRIGQREAQRAASRLAVRAVGIAEEVRRGRGDDRDVDVHLAILHRLPASAMRAQHAHPRMLPCEQ